MRLGIIVAVLLLAGCLGPTPEPAATMVVEARAPAPAIILPAPVTQPIEVLSVSPHHELRFNETGLRALNVTLEEPWTVSEFLVDGHHDRPVFLIVHPTRLPSLDPCSTAPNEIRWHSFISEQGNVLGHAFAAGQYTLLLYSERLANLSLRLGADPERIRIDARTYAPAVGLEIIQAEIHIGSVAFPFRAGFGQALGDDGSVLFLSEFRHRSNAHSGPETLSSQLGDAQGNICALDAQGRNGLSGIDGFASRFASVLGRGTNQWSGSFESNASANPRFDATGYALRFVD